MFKRNLPLIGAAYAKRPGRGAGRPGPRCLGAAGGTAIPM